MPTNHPTAARGVHYKEPDEDSTVNFNVTHWRKKDPTTTITSVETVDPAPKVTPTEEHRRVSIGAVTRRFKAGEKCTASGGATLFAVNATQDGDATMDFYIETSEQSTTVVASGETITGTRSGASTVTSSAETKQGDGVLIESQTSTAQIAQVNLTNGLRPLEGRPWREYLVTIYVNLSDSQKLPLIGSVRVPQAAAASNPS